MIDPIKREYGIQLTDEVTNFKEYFFIFLNFFKKKKGVDSFKAKINIEVQWVVSELTIAAIERNGGMITNKYYDIQSLIAMCDPVKFFKSGKPIPKNCTPPLNAIEFYTSASNRGYLADPEQIIIERLKLAQKYGYELNDLSKDPLKNMFSLRKDPRQIWHGLEPGWLVNMKDKVILKPNDKEWIDYYKS